jgi:NAD(P)-dependent dehydrogenase (short-subunit alcohol dehydrogenase family)
MSCKISTIRHTHIRQQNRIEKTKGSSHIMANPKIVFITGANTGIGFEVVKALYSADKPYTVIVGSRSLSKAEDAISSLKTEFPASTNILVPLTIDIESDESIQSAADEVESKFGRVDALINNAGTFTHTPYWGKVANEKSRRPIRPRNPHRHPNPARRLAQIVERQRRRHPSPHNNTDPPPPEIL